MRNQLVIYYSYDFGNKYFYKVRPLILNLPLQNFSFFNSWLTTNEYAETPLIKLLYLEGTGGL